MNEPSARIAMLIGLPSAAVFVFMLSGEIVDRWFQIDALQTTCAISTAGVVSACLICLGKFVQWRAAKTWWTIGFTAALAVHVIVFKPMWNVGGCVGEEILKTSQCMTAAGMWIGGCALLWWGTLAFRRHTRKSSARRNQMSTNGIRLVIGYALVFLLPGLYFISFLMLEDVFKVNDEWSSFCSYELCATITIAVWILIWRTSVAWTKRARVVTALLALALLLSPLCVHLDGNFFTETIEYLVPLIVASAWFAGTALVWRPESAQIDAEHLRDSEIGESIRCPECDYGMTGLREARCPECGRQSNLDEVVKRSLDALLTAD